MWLVWVANAAAAPTVALSVTDTGGSVVLDVERELPYEETVTVGKAGVSVYVATFDGRRAVLEIAAGRKTRGGVRVRAATSVELDPHLPAERSIVWRKETFRVRGVLGNPVAAPDPVAAPPTPSRFVRVWDDAARMTSPRAPREATRERELPAGRVDAAHEGSPMRVVDLWGETHLEVASLPGAGREHCGAGAEGSVAWPLQSYVARSDLATVTTRALTARFPDGSAYHVAPGVAAVARGGGHALVSSGGLSFEVEVTEGDLGVFYAPGEIRPPGDAGLTFAVGTVGHTALGPVTWTGPSPLRASGVDGIERPFVILRAPCLEVTVPFTPDRGTAPSSSP